MGREQPQRSKNDKLSYLAAEPLLPKRSSTPDFFTAAAGAQEGQVSDDDELQMRLCTLQPYKLECFSRL